MVIATSDGQIFESDTHMAVGQPMQTAEVIDTKTQMAPEERAKLFSKPNSYGVEWDSRTGDEIADMVHENGAMRYGEHHPGVQELIKRNPKDIDIFKLKEFNGDYDKDFSDETVIIRSKRQPALTS